MPGVNQPLIKLQEESPAGCQVLRNRNKAWRVHIAPGKPIYGVQIGLSLKMDYSLVSISPLCCDRNGTVCVNVVNATLAIYRKPELNVKQLMLF